MNAPRPPGGEKPAVDIRLSVQRSPRDHPRLALAQRVEALGFDALLVGDHRDSGASPWLALASAAAVTERIRLGTYVLQAGVREPLDMANDAATLDLLDPGRVVLGMGAGHTPVEWGAIGRRRPAPAKRIARL